MVFVWAAASYNFYLIMFLANTFEQVYVTALCLSVADIISYTISSVLVEKITVKHTITISFAVSMVGGLVILLYGLAHEESAAFPLLFFISKFGISSAFNAVYVGNTRIFPATVAASTLGICQVLARLSSALQFFTTSV